MIGEILKAFKKRYDDNKGAGSLYALTGGRLYLASAADEPSLTFPYGVFFAVSSTPQRSDRQANEDTRIQVNLWSETLDDAIALESAAISLWHEQELTFDTGRQTVVLQREMTTGPLQIEDYWQVTVEFRLISSA